MADRAPYFVLSTTYEPGVYEGIDAENIQDARVEWTYAVRSHPHQLHILRTVEGYQETDVLQNDPKEDEGLAPKEIWLVDQPLWITERDDEC
jgi:hypothetical protein